MSGTGASSKTIFNLTVDCCDEIFEYLPLNDLHSIGQTCKSLQKVAADYFERNYKSSQKCISDNDIWMQYNSKHYYLSGFNEFITRAEINRDDFIGMNVSEFKSLKEIFFINFHGNDKLFETILPQIEVVRIAGEMGFDDFYEDCLKFCANLKEIYVYDDYNCGILHPALSNNWLNRKYPSLKVVHLIPSYAYKIHELPSFLEINSTIRKLSVDLKLLWENGEELLQSNVKLDVLKVWDLFFCDSMDIHVFCTLLKKLYKRGFYKKLHFEVCTLKFVKELSTFDTIESLEFDELDENCNLTQLISLKYLAVRQYNEFLFPSHLTKLINLEQLVLNFVNFGDLLTLICEMVKLKKIKIDNYKGELNLIKLNKERGTLNGARKVTICVPEDIFVKTKWSTRNGDINLMMIEMIRRDSQ